ncbi:hypothetical protein VTJ83DRAFT_5260 [Remersonia thermophila]|uniref:UV-damage endonuclease n=1 Tax=Remersonia thermophila TaxID=72144 RepID=A0ABR4D6B6_9PEZI
MLSFYTSRLTLRSVSTAVSRIPTFRVSGNPSLPGVLLSRLSTESSLPSSPSRSSSNPLRHSFLRRYDGGTACRPALAMPRKNTTRVPSGKEGELTTHDPDAAGRPQVQLRRSGRMVSRPVPPGDVDNAGLMLCSTPLGDEDQSTGEPMGLAIEELTKLDRRLRSQTKRQKILMEAEMRPTGVRTVVTGGIKATEPVPARASMPSMREQLLTPDEGTVEMSDVVNAGRKDDMSLGAGGCEPSEEVPDMAERGAARRPAVNSSYLPLPWTGRLGYACLNTYLRSAKTPVFCSRTCRIASIIDHRYPLADPSMPEHPTKNRPDKTQKPSVERGLKFVQNLGLANARDMVRMLRWNDKYGIKFMRLSSEMFPFASHPEHGYRLAPFASDVLAEAGRMAAELGHRLTMHPGQFTQLGSPRKEVVDAAVRDLEYHDELLSLLRLPEQLNRDAVMIIHMGGVFGDKAATLDRFRKNYAKLSPSIKARLVLENDDVSWSVHDLLPLCEELNIPLVLDYHHHNIVFDSTQVREGTLDISAPDLQARIAATWSRKGIRQKMHYSESCPGAVTPRDRRKHSPRVMTLPPCPADMDLMIEAKDKEQAVFELMRTFKLPGFERINDMIPHERQDEPQLVQSKTSATNKKEGKPTAAGKRKRPSEEDKDEVNDLSADDTSKQPAGRVVSDEDYAMGGPDNRVYWPPGNEAWLKPLKRGSKAVLEETEE